MIILTIYGGAFTRLLSLTIGEMPVMEHIYIDTLAEWIEFNKDKFDAVAISSDAEFMKELIRREVEKTGVKFYE